MRGNLKCSAVVLFCVMAMAGCLAKQPVQPINTQPLDAQTYRPKADNLVILLDASSSMDSLYQSNVKFDIAAALAKGFINTVPDMDMDAGLISFGHSKSVSNADTLVLRPLARFDRKALLDGLGKVTRAGGISPLNLAIDAAAGLLKDKEGRKALIIISDGEDMGKAPLAAAQALKNAYKGNICIHTIQVGVNPQGTQLLKAISETTACGTARNADTLKSGQQLAAYVKEVLLEQGMDSDGDGVMDDTDKCPNTPAGASVDARGCPLDSDSDGVYDGLDQCPGTPRGITVNSSGCALDDDGDGVPNAKDACPDTPANIAVGADGCPVDSDGDGVADYLDQCPGTSPGMKVDRSGCPIPTAAGAQVTDAGTWIFEDVQFESGKADLKAGSEESLDEVASLLKQHPNIKLEIQGHTDSMGNAAYNYRLSENRAKAVKAYLVEHGISATRLTAKGYGPSKPIAGNETAQGRAKNRRVEFKPY